MVSSRDHSARSWSLNLNCYQRFRDRRFSVSVWSLKLFRDRVSPCRDRKASVSNWADSCCDFSLLICSTSSDVLLCSKLTIFCFGIKFLGRDQMGKQGACRYHIWVLTFWVWCESFFHFCHFNFVLGNYIVLAIGEWSFVFSTGCSDSCVSSKHKGLVGKELLSKCKH